MSKRPAFQFYAGDWLRNAKLRRCSPAARGVWIDVMCLMHDSEDEYGVLRWPLKDIAQATGASMAHLRELVEKGVLKGADKNAAPYVYQPRSGGKLGEPATLVEPGTGPCWYCSRFVRDEHVRRRRGEGSRFDSDENQPNRSPKASPKRQPKPPFGDGLSDGSSSSSAFANNTHTTGGAAEDEFSPAPSDPAFWQPDLKRLSAQLQFAGIPMPTEEDLRQALVPFNLHYADQNLTENERYGKLVKWLTGDHRNGKQQQAPASGAAPAGNAAAARKPTPVEQTIAANRQFLIDNGIDPDSGPVCS